MLEKFDIVFGYLKEFLDYYKYVMKKIYIVNEKIIFEDEKVKSIFFIVEGYVVVELEDNLRKMNYIFIFVFLYNVLGIDVFFFYLKKKYSIMVMSEYLMFYKIDVDFLFNILLIKFDVNDFFLISIVDVFVCYYVFFGMIVKMLKEWIYMVLENFVVEMGIEDEERNEIVLLNFINQLVFVRYCCIMQLNIFNLLIEFVEEEFLVNKKSFYWIDKDFLDI